MLIRALAGVYFYGNGAGCFWILKQTLFLQTQREQGFPGISYYNKSQIKFIRIWVQSDYRTIKREHMICTV